MPCYHPLTGYRSKDLNPTGKRSIVFNPGPSAALSGIPLKLPCGQCLGCKLERSRQWAIRCVHEASLYDENSFLTLTYSDENLPSDGSLVLKHHQDFLKRLRKHLWEPNICPCHDEVKKVRFFHCGEYGEKRGRPHYHTLLFGHDFLDKTLVKEERGNRYYTSAQLKSLWPHGNNILGDVTFESAAYVARYILKKIPSDADPEMYYEGRKPEYVTMSRRPGIAHNWLEKYKSDVFPSDEIIIRGKRMPPPRAYIKKLSELEQAELRLARHRKAARNPSADNSHLRLLTREEVHELTALLLKRDYEHEA